MLFESPFAKKSIEHLQREGTKKTGFERVLGLWTLTAIDWAE
ncbi:hypothetical protein ACFO25_09135 [Paenactinomyces guangxiensis]|nr:hypothetical protein [Paenactinomyces guangxiensis]